MTVAMPTPYDTPCPTTVSQAQRGSLYSRSSGSEGSMTVAPRRRSSGVDAGSWEIAFDQLRIERAVGSGSFGKASGEGSLHGAAASAVGCNADRPEQADMADTT